MPHAHFRYIYDYWVPTTILILIIHFLYYLYLNHVKIWLSQTCLIWKHKITSEKRLFSHRTQNIFISVFFSILPLWEIKLLGIRLIVISLILFLIKYFSTYGVYIMYTYLSSFANGDLHQCNAKLLFFYKTCFLAKLNLVCFQWLYFHCRYKVAQTIALGWEYGQPRVMSSYFFTDSELGPPSSGSPDYM